jgi:hypothetical protein
VLSEQVDGLAALPASWLTPLHKQRLADLTDEPIGVEQVSVS